MFNINMMFLMDKLVLLIHLIHILLNPSILDPFSFIIHHPTLGLLLFII